MKVIRTRNVHQALPIALADLEERGYERDSRNGSVTLFNTPVTTEYTHPKERVMFWADRDCNPFFHFFESLWMLAGRNDVAFVTKFVKTMSNFSDDGKTFHGAYGHRWRTRFGFDQLEIITETLKADPNDRRCVLQMWSPASDLGMVGKDFPCNMSACFSVDQYGDLTMTVFNRSNDLVWGAYGANAVHFSMLQEYVASVIGRDVGSYYHVSNNLHAYHDTLEKVKKIRYGVDPYVSKEVQSFPIMQTLVEDWNTDLKNFLENNGSGKFKDPFFNHVAKPLYKAHEAYKNLEGICRYDVAAELLQDCSASDWRKASLEWVDRRKTKFMAK